MAIRSHTEPTQQSARGSVVRYMLVALAAVIAASVHEHLRQPPADSCYSYACYDVISDCSSCDCLVPHLAYDTLAPATCQSDDSGHLWIDGAPRGLLPWKDPCAGRCSADEACWECGPYGGCMPESTDPFCRTSLRCSADNPTGFPHPTCRQVGPL